MVQDEPGGPSSRGEVINEFLGRTDSDGALLAGSGSQRPLLSQTLQGSRDGPATGFMDLVARAQGDRSNSSRVDHDRMLHSLLSAPPQSRGAAARPKSAQAPASAPDSRQLCKCAEPPMDWSLKQTVRFSSPGRLALVDDGLQAPSAAVAAGMRSFAGSDPERGLGLQDQWQRALMTWRFPCQPLKLKEVEQIERSSLADLVLSPRKLAFQEALCSAFTQLRSGSCAAFYVVAPDGARNASVILFRAAGVAGRPKIHALVSRSTQAMRALMRGEQYQLRFSMPLCEDQQTAPIKDGSAGDAAAAIRPDEIPGGTASDGKPRSLLFLEGMAEVAGLFDVIVNDGATFWAAARADVPSIVAPVAFEGASISRLSPWLVRTGGASSAIAGGSQVELSGVVPPWTVDRLRGCLQLAPLETEGGAFSMWADTIDISSNLNCVPAPVAAGWRPPNGAPADLGADCCMASGGWCSREERERWMTERDLESVGQGVVASANFVVAEGYSVTLKAAGFASTRVL